MIEPRYGVLQTLFADPGLPHSTRLCRGRACDQEAGVGATSKSAFPGLLVQGRRCAVGPFRARINIPRLFSTKHKAQSSIATGTRNVPELGISLFR
jgi:hypothetical protein